MKVRIKLTAGLVLLVGFLVWYRCSSRVLAKEVSTSGEAFILVREMQLSPFSLKGFLRLNPIIYRFEYYPHADWPMLTAQTFFEESYVANSVNIEWKTADAAKVTVDGVITFECVKGQWRKVD
jgi:hypothetical protein